MGYKSDKSWVVRSCPFLLEVNWLILGGSVDSKGVPYSRHRWGRVSCAAIETFTSRHRAACGKPLECLVKGDRSVAEAVQNLGRHLAGHEILPGCLMCRGLSLSCETATWSKCGSSERDWASREQAVPLCP